VGLNDVRVEGGKVLAWDEVCKVHEGNLRHTILTEELKGEALLICCNVDMIDPWSKLADGEQGEHDLVAGSRSTALWDIACSLLHLGPELWVSTLDPKDHYIHRWQGVRFPSRLLCLRVSTQALGTCKTMIRLLNRNNNTIAVHAVWSVCRDLDNFS
jgi:hypothetical protein